MSASSSEVERAMTCAFLLLSGEHLNACRELLENGVSINSISSLYPPKLSALNVALRTYLEGGGRIIFHSAEMTSEIDEQVLKLWPLLTSEERLQTQDALAGTSPFLLNASNKAFHEHLEQHSQVRFLRESAGLDEIRIDLATLQRALGTLLISMLVRAQRLAWQSTCS